MISALVSEHDRTTSAVSSDRSARSGQSLSPTERLLTPTGASHRSTELTVPPLVIGQDAGSSRRNSRCKDRASSVHLSRLRACPVESRRMTSRNPRCCRGIMPGASGAARSSPARAALQDVAGSQFMTERQAEHDVPSGQSGTLPECHHRPDRAVGSAGRLRHLGTDRFEPSAATHLRPRRAGCRCAARKPQVFLRCSLLACRLGFATARLATFKPVSAPGLVSWPIRPVAIP